MRYRCYGFLSVFAFLLVNLLSWITTIGQSATDVCFEICTGNKQQAYHCWTLHSRLPSPHPLSLTPLTSPHLAVTPSPHPSHLTSACCYPPHPLSLTPLTPFTPPHCHLLTSWPTGSTREVGTGLTNLVMWHRGQELKLREMNQWVARWYTY